MNILLAGGHNETRFLARTLRLNNHHITVINEEEAFCTLLADEYDVISVCGNGADPNVLRNARVDKMDLVVALEHKDAANLVICEIAKKQFHASKTIAVVTDPRNTELFRELGVDCCICITDFLVNIIEGESN